jgi:hypothetical protein
MSVQAESSVGGAERIHHRGGPSGSGTTELSSLMDGGICGEVKMASKVLLWCLLLALALLIFCTQVPL